MTRAEAEQLVHLLGLLEAECPLRDFRRSIGEVRGLALAAVCLAPDDTHSVKAPARLRLVV